MKRLSFALWVLVAAPALAQPMMVDPAQMSGIPRPDPQVPAGTVTVRLIRGELQNRMVGHEVELRHDKGEVKKAKTDDQGRATFEGVSGGPWFARAAADDVEVVSQAIELPPQIGVRVMLVFPRPDAPDGIGRPDKKIPPGTIIVKAVDGDGQPLAGVEVVLGHARAGENTVRELKGRTDAAGEAKFEGLDAKTNSGYLVQVIRDGAQFVSKPFKLVENAGSRVIIEARPTVKDTSQLQIGPGSHLAFEVRDDAIEVFEMWRLENLGTSAVDAPGGLHIPLPEKAVNAQVGPQAPPNFSIAGKEAVWKGPLPPGVTDLQVAFVLPYRGDSAEIRQATPVRFAEVNVVTEKIDGMTVTGDGFTSEEREMQGRKLVLYRGAGTTAGGELVITIGGLPHANPTWRYVAALVAVLIVVGFGVVAARGGAATSHRAALEQRRDELLEELTALEVEGKKGKRGEELRQELQRLYKEIDEASA